MSEGVRTLEYFAVLHRLNVLADNYGALKPLTVLEPVAVPVLAAGWRVCWPGRMDWFHLRVAL
jgi:hypothetical protein